MKTNLSTNFVNAIADMPIDKVDISTESVAFMCGQSRSYKFLRIKNKQKMSITKEKVKIFECFTASARHLSDFFVELKSLKSDFSDLRAFRFKYPEAAFYTETADSYIATYCCNSGHDGLVELKKISNVLPDGATLSCSVSLKYQPSKCKISVFSKPRVHSYFKIARIAGYSDWLQPKKLVVARNSAVELDETVMPELILNVAKSVTVPGTKTLDYVVAVIISLMGTFLAQHFRVITGDKVALPCFPNIWSVLVGDSGAGKTPAIRSVLQCAEQLFIEDDPDAARYVKMTTQAIERASRKHLYEVAMGEQDATVSLKILENHIEKRLSATLGDTIKWKAGLYRTTDASLAGLNDLLNKSKPVTYIADELKSLLNELKQDSKLRALLLNAATGLGQHTVTRANNRSKSIANPLMTVVAGVQPDSLAPFISAALAGDESNDGMINRFQYLVLNISDFEDSSMEGGFSQLKLNNGHKFFNSLRNSYLFMIDGRPDALINVPFSLEAHKSYKKWMRMQERWLSETKSNRLLQSQIKKYPMTICGLSLIFEVVLNYDLDEDVFVAPSSISVEAFNYAISTLSYIYSHTKIVFGENGTAINESASVLYEKLRELSQDSPMSASEIAQRGWKGNRLRDSGSILKLLEYLESYGYVRQFKKGRKIVWELNPLAEFN